MAPRDDGNRRQHFLVDDVLHARALHVDGRRFAGDGHSLFERADSQLGADGCDEVATQLDALAFHGVETGQRKCHCISARTKIDDAILTGVVADDRARALDQDGTCRFNRDTWQYCARRIPDYTCDGGLRKRSRGKEQDHQEGRHRSPREDTHRVPPPLGFPGKTGNVMVRMRAGMCEPRLDDDRMNGVGVPRRRGVYGDESRSTFGGKYTHSGGWVAEVVGERLLPWCEQGAAGLRTAAAAFKRLLGEAGLSTRLKVVVRNRAAC